MYSMQLYWPRYCVILRAWSGYCSAADRNRLDAFLHRAHKLGLCADISETIVDRFNAADDALFKRIVNNSHNVLRPLLSERMSNGYNLRSKQRDFILLDKTNHLTDSGFIIHSHVVQKLLLSLLFNFVITMCFFVLR